jgi:phosphatidylserine/phosphatidylglycerophosphate/cardiolipin synthase-like enzyme
MADPPFTFPPDVPPVDPLGEIEEIPPIQDIPPINAPPPVTPVKRTKDPKVDAFFLPPVEDPDPLVFRGDVGDSLNVTPLIDGNDIFTELEKAIMNAESSVLIAFWALAPDMKTITDPWTTWMDLLLETAERDVMVRVLMNDFDPGLQTEEHATVWKRYWTMLAAAAQARIPPDKFQVVCSHHEAETSHEIMGTVKPDLYDKTVVPLINKQNARTRKAIYGFSPGLWDKLNLKSGNKVATKFKGKNYPAWPASHHQKIIIVDGKFAYTGGLNVTEQYVDTQKHLKRVLPWHDAFVKVEGVSAVKDFIRNYIGLWNQERLRAESFLKDAYRALFFHRHATPFIGITTDLTEAMIPAVLTSAVAPKIPSQVHRTISKRGTAKSGVPITVREDVFEGYLEAIGQAEGFIYLENQYFREEKLADAIIQQHKAKPDLQTIIVVPRIIEEFLKSAGDPLSNYGAALQFELLSTMKKEIKTNLGLFTLRRKDDKLIYVHGKLFIIDDKFASIGSANTNPRSFRMDSELDFVWHNETVSQKLRLDLWKEILGNPPILKDWSPTQFISKWSEIAKKNLKSRRAQKGFVIPFDNKTKGKKIPFLDLSPFV